MTIENFVPLLQRSLKDESSVTCKMACAAVRVRIYIYHVARIIFKHVNNASLCLSVSFGRFIIILSVFTQPQHCIMALCNGSLSELGLQLLIDLMTLKDCSYWLVRTELLETLAEIDFR